MIKKYKFLNLVAVVIFGFSITAYSMDIKLEDDGESEIEQNKIEQIEIHEPTQALPGCCGNLETNDLMKKLIESNNEMEILKIICYCCLLNKNYEQYLTLIQKTLDQSDINVKSRFNRYNFVRLLKTTLTSATACGLGCVLYWLEQAKESLGEHKFEYWMLNGSLVFTIPILGIYTFSELKKIWNNYDLKQENYRLLSIARALKQFKKICAKGDCQKPNSVE